MNAALQNVLAKVPEDRFESCAAFVAALGGTHSCASAGKTRIAAALLVVLTIGVLVGGGLRLGRETGKDGEKVNGSGRVVNSPDV